MQVKAILSWCSCCHCPKMNLLTSIKKGLLTFTTKVLFFLSISLAQFTQPLHSTSTARLFHLDCPVWKTGKFVHFSPSTLCLHSVWCIRGHARALVQQGCKDGYKPWMMKSIHNWGWLQNKTETRVCFLLDVQGWTCGWGCKMSNFLLIILIYVNTAKFIAQQLLLVKARKTNTHIKCLDINPWLLQSQFQTWFGRFIDLFHALASSQWK